MSVGRLLGHLRHQQQAGALLQASRCLSTCLQPQQPSSLLQPFHSQPELPWGRPLPAQQCWSAAAASALTSCKRQFFTPFSSPDSKVYKERRLIGYSPEQLYQVVSSVQHYHQFVPWCVGSRVLSRTSDGSYLEAELQIGFQMISERYTSKVQLQPPHSVSSTVANSGLFHHLESVWQMRPGPSPNTTWLSFSVDFAFLNPLYANVAHLFFQEVVTRMMGAFEGRCKHLFGPPAFAAPCSRGQRLAPHHHQQQQHGENSSEKVQQQQRLEHAPPVAATVAEGGHSKREIVSVHPGSQDRN